MMTETKPSDLDPPPPSILRRLETLTIDAASKFLGMPKRPKGDKPPPLTTEQYAQIRDIEIAAIGNYTGDLTQLEAALGMLRMGHYFGWKVLYIVHSKKTIRTYEEILGIRIRDVFDDTGPLSSRSLGLNIALRYPNFWKVVGGDIKIPRRQEIA